MFIPDFGLLIFMAPAFLLAFWAQMRVKSTYAEAQQVPVPLSGAGAARHILDSAGLQHVGIEQIPGQLSDHYDPRDKVLRLSQGVYGACSTAAVGIAAHEAGHALQDAKNYGPLVIRNAAVPVASIGGSFGSMLAMAGLAFVYMGVAVGKPMLLLGILAIACVVFFQLVNLPVEFDASARAKRLLVEHGIVADQDMVYVNRVLNAAAWTYVAGTLQAVLTLLYYIMRYAGSSND